MLSRVAAKNVEDVFFWDTVYNYSMFYCCVWSVCVLPVSVWSSQSEHSRQFSFKPRLPLCCRLSAWLSPVNNPWWTLTGKRRNSKHLYANNSCQFVNGKNYCLLLLMIFILKNMVIAFHEGHSDCGFQPVECVLFTFVEWLQSIFILNKTAKYIFLY